MEKRVLNESIRDVQEVRTPSVQAVGFQPTVQNPNAGYSPTYGSNVGPAIGRDNLFAELGGAILNSAKIFSEERKNFDLQPYIDIYSAINEAVNSGQISSSQAKIQYQKLDDDFLKANGNNKYAVSKFMSFKSAASNGTYGRVDEQMNARKAVTNAYFNLTGLPVDIYNDVEYNKASAYVSNYMIEEAKYKQELQKLNIAKQNFELNDKQREEISNNTRVQGINTVNAIATPIFENMTKTGSVDVEGVDRIISAINIGISNAAPNMSTSDLSSLQKYGDALITQLNRLKNSTNENLKLNLEKTQLLLSTSVANGTANPELLSFALAYNRYSPEDLMVFNAYINKPDVENATKTGDTIAKTGNLNAFFSWVKDVFTKTYAKGGSTQTLVNVAESNPEVVKRAMSQIDSGGKAFMLNRINSERADQLKNLYMYSENYAKDTEISFKDGLFVVAPKSGVKPSKGLLDYCERLQLINNNTMEAYYTLFNFDIKDKESIDSIASSNTFKEFTKALEAYGEYKSE